MFRRTLPAAPTNRFRFRSSHCETLETRALLAGDLVAHWSASEMANIEDGAVIESWNDAVGDRTGVVFGDPVFVQNAFDGRPAVQFDGDDLVRIDNLDSPVSGANEFTVAVVFAANSSSAPSDSGQWYQHMGLVDSSTAGFSTDWGIALNQSGQISAGMGGGFGTTATTVTSSESDLDNQERQIAIVSRTGGTLSIYVNGGAASTVTTASSAARTNTIDLVLGGNQTNSAPAPFSGMISEVRFYDGFMNAAEADQLHSQILSFYQNEPPQAVNDTYTVEEDPLFFFVNISAEEGVLANDTDADGDSLTATLVESTQHGTLSFDADGSFVYAPERDFFGTDTFTYTVNDFRPGNTATVTINVTNKYDAASGVADTYLAQPQQVLSVDAVGGVLANDNNPDQTNLQAVLETGVTNGQLQLSSDGSFTYDAQGFAGTTQFTYRVDDGAQLSSPVTVTLQVNTDPIGNSDTFAVSEDVLFVASALQGVLANDVDADGDALTASLVSPPTNGTIEFAADGSFQYSPNPDYFGSDSFTYAVADWLSVFEEVTVNLQVSAVNDAPLATGDVYFLQADETLDRTATAGLLANDLDVDSLTLNAQLVSGPSHGSFELQANGAFRYVPQAGFVGVDSVQYVANDGSANSATVTVELYVGTSPVRISEFLTANLDSLETRVRATVEDRFSGLASLEDWIEIQNLTTSDLDISGFHLTDNNGNLQKWTFPEGTTIPAASYLTVFATNRNITDPALDELGMLHTNFALGVEGEYLAITSRDGTPLHEFDNYPLQVPGVTYGITESGVEAYLVTATPNAANSNDQFDGLVQRPVVDQERGFYAAPFQVTIASETPGAVIRYTTDGSEPTEANGTVYSGPINISTTTTLRTTAFKAGSLASRTTTHTYLFLSDVVNQPDMPAGYPDQFGLGINNSGAWAPRPADYGMDPEITQNPAYADLMDDALTAIPSISITTSVANLFDREIGIYQNTDGHGEEWERPASIEMILPDGTTAFQIDAGIRMQGGASREPWKNPKHGFRLKFKGIYGSDDLEYDWFGNGAVTQFDEIVLRAGANQAWLHHNNFLGDNRGRAQYIRDQWAADTYRAMGNPAPHTDYAHLYVNGMYWGLYNPKERPTADFAASYFGGNAYDYDVVNAGELLDGDLDAWRRLNHRDYRDLSDPALYEEFSQLLDIDSFMDYMIMNHYGGNMDWDSHNWYAAANRNTGKFYFIPWDEEFVFISPNDNRINIRDGAPGQLLQKLRTNDEFLVQFADRIQELMFNDGLLTPDSVVERWNLRSEQVELPIIGESARWGDFRRDVDRQGIAGPFELLERDVQWMAERNRLLNDYFPVRTDIVVEQYRRAGLFPDTPAPSFSQRGGYLSSTDPISLSADAGQVYYTTDGSDPRLPGGQLNPNATLYAGSFRLSTSATVRTRTLNGEEWSALDQAFFAVDTIPADSTNLRISEINFNPGDANAAEVAAGFGNDDFEFIEVTNISNQSIDLSGVRFVQLEIEGDTQGIDFQFADQTLLAPGTQLMVVEDADAMALRYGVLIPVAGQWSGRLSNSSETITLMTGDQIIQQFAYDDAWHAAADGDGATLESVDPSSNNLAQWGQAAGWRASGVVGGSPGSLVSNVVGDVTGDGVFNSSDLVAIFTAGEYEDGIAGNSTYNEGDWNGDGDFTTADLVLAFQAGTYVAEARIAASANDTSLDANWIARWYEEPSKRFSKETDEVFALDFDFEV